MTFLTLFTVVFWVLYHLASNPEYQEKCYEEICEKYKGGPLTWEAMKEIK